MTSLSVNCIVLKCKSRNAWLRLVERIFLPGNVSDIKQKFTLTEKPTVKFNATFKIRYKEKLQKRKRGVREPILSFPSAGFIPGY